jgi:hypothetical protein
LHDHHQTTLHQDPEYISDSQSHQTTQLSTGIASFNVHLPPNLHAKVVQNQVMMTPMKRFKDPSVFPYQQHGTYEPLPDSSYDNASRLETPTTPYQYSDETFSTQMYSRSGYSSMRSAHREPAYYEDYRKSWTASDGPVEGGGLAGVGTQFDYYQTA